MTDISIVIPVYNVEAYLRRCLDTVVDQTFNGKYEIICVNDGSTDNSGEILNEYASKYSGLFKIINQENKGLSEARNIALKYVTGKYTMFVDSDDFIAQNALEKLYDYAEAHNSEVVVFDFLKASQGQKQVIRMHYKTVKKKYGDSTFNADIAESYVYKTIVPGVWSKFYLTDLIKNIKFVPGVIYEDVCYWTEIFTRAKKINYYPVPFYFYIMHRENSLTEDKTGKVFDVFKVFPESEKVLKETGYYEKYKNYYNASFASYIMGAVKKMNPDIKKEYIDKIKNYNFDIDFDVFLNGNYERYEKEDVYFLKLVKESDYKTVEEFCYKVGIWRKR